MQSQKITRRNALAGAGAAAGALAVAYPLTAVVAEAEDHIKLERLWSAWCSQLVAVRKAHEVLYVRGEPVGVTNAERQKARMNELAKRISDSSSTPGGICLRLALWKWRRHDFVMHRHSGSDEIDGMLLGLYETLRKRVPVDFDNIAAEAGLRIELPDGSIQGGLSS